MPPKPVSLANAGRKLQGPPEGYGRRKELQARAVAAPRRGRRLPVHSRRLL
jgi:hypothetical protein